MLLMIYGVQLVGVLSISIAAAAIFCGVSLLKKKREDDSEDDLGYLENIIHEKGGFEDEKI